MSRTQTRCNHIQSTITLLIRVAEQQTELLDSSTRLGRPSPNSRVFLPTNSLTARSSLNQLIEQEKLDLAGLTASISASATPVSAPPSPTKPQSPTRPTPAPAPAPQPQPEKPAMPPRTMGIALPGLTGPRVLPPSAPIEQAPEPVPLGTPTKPLEDVRKNRVKPPRPPRGKAVHLEVDEEEAAEGAEEGSSESVEVPGSVGCSRMSPCCRPSQPTFVRPTGNTTAHSTAPDNRTILANRPRDPAERTFSD
jgi:hypothetical protein